MTIMDTTTKQSQSPPILTSISKTNNVVVNSLHRTIQHHVQSKEYNSQTDGLDFLQVKNGLMISYLIDLTLLLRSRLNNNSNQPDDDSNDNDNESEENKQQKGKSSPIEQQQQQQHCLNRLLEMKTALEKIRPLEKRMRYQIDKLLALATLGAGTFAGREEEEEEEKEENKEEKVNDDLKGEEGQEDKTMSDPLSFKPDLQGMMKMFEEDNNEQNDNESNSDSHDSDDDDEAGSPSSKPRIAIEKDDNDNNNQAYQPPRLQSVPFELQNNETLLAKQRLQLQKAHAKQSRSELTALLRSQLTDAPETEDARGGAMLGNQSEKSRRIKAKEDDVREFEESQMIRLTVGKKDKKERKRMMREEMSNLGAIAGGLGGLVAGVGDAFGSGGDGRGGSYRGNDDGDNNGRGEYKMKGMRKRKVDVLEQKPKSKSKKKGAANTYQKSLYGGRGGGDGGGKSRKRK